MIDEQTPDRMSRRLSHRTPALVGCFASGEELKAIAVRLNRALSAALKQVLPRIVPPHDQTILTVTERASAATGLDQVIELIPGDRVAYVQLRGSGTWVPVIEGAMARRRITDQVTIVAERASDGNYWLLRSCYAGPHAPPSPTDAKVRFNQAAERVAREFWCRHALCKEHLIRARRIVPGSETDCSPW